MSVIGVKWHRGSAGGYSRGTTGEIAPDGTVTKYQYVDPVSGNWEYNKKIGRVATDGTVYEYHYDSGKYVEVVIGKITIKETSESTCMCVDELTGAEFKLKKIYDDGNTPWFHDWPEGWYYNGDDLLPFAVAVMLLTAIKKRRKTHEWQPLAETEDSNSDYGAYQDYLNALDPGDPLGRRKLDYGTWVKWGRPRF